MNKPIVIVTAHTALSVNVIYLEACGKNVDLTMLHFKQG